MQETQTKLLDEAFEEEKAALLKRAKTLLFRVIKKERARKERRRLILEEQERRTKLLEAEHAAALAAIAETNSTTSLNVNNVEQTNRSVGSGKTTSSPRIQLPEPAAAVAVEPLASASQHATALDETSEKTQIDDNIDESVMETSTASDTDDNSNDWLSYKKLAAVAQRLEETTTPEEFNQIVLEFLQKIYSDYVQYRRSEQLKYRAYLNNAPVVTPRRRSHLMDIEDMSKRRMEERAQRAQDFRIRRKQYDGRVKELRRQQLEKAEQERQRRAEAAAAELKAKLEQQQREQMEAMQRHQQNLEKQRNENSSQAVPTTIEGWLALPILKDVQIYKMNGGKHLGQHSSKQPPTAEDLLLAANQRAKNLENKKKRLAERIRKSEEMYEHTIEWEEEATKKMDLELGSLRHQDLTMYVPPWLLNDKDRLDLDKVRLSGEGIFQDELQKKDEHNNSNTSFFMTELDHEANAESQKQEIDESEGYVDDEYSYEDISDDLMIQQGSSGDMRSFLANPRRNDESVEDDYTYSSKDKQTMKSKKSSKGNTYLRSPGESSSKARSISPVNDKLLRMTLHQLSSHLMMNRKRQLISPELLKTKESTHTSPTRSSVVKKEAAGESSSERREHEKSPQKPTGETQEHWTSVSRAKSNRKKKIPYVPKRNFSPPPLRPEQYTIGGGGSGGTGLIYAKPRGKQLFATPSATAHAHRDKVTFEETSRMASEQRDRRHHQSSTGERSAVPTVPTSAADGQQRAPAKHGSRGSIRLISSREMDEQAMNGDDDNDGNINFETRLLKMSSRGGEQQAATSTSSAQATRTRKSTATAASASELQLKPSR